MTGTEPPPRPRLEASMDADEFSRWYWLKTELADFARANGLSATGGKEHLAGRIMALLDGRPQPAAPPAKRASRQLANPLSADTLIPAGQRCSQILRGWFEGQLGAGFHFDSHMRDFIASADGTSTLADAVAHWSSTRNAPAPEVGAQFELNRFTRDWFAANADGTREDMIAAWKRHRSLPKDLRP